MLYKIKVITGSKKQKIEEKKQDELVVNVKSKPEQGKANQELLNLLSVYFDLPVNKIKIIRGLKSHNKIIELKI